MQPQSPEDPPASRWAWDYDIERGVTMVTMPIWAFWLTILLTLIGVALIFHEFTV